jgi:MoxR-like ATPase
MNQPIRSTHDPENDSDKAPDRAPDKVTEKTSDAAGDKAALRAAVAGVRAATGALRANVGRVFVGKEHVVDLLLVTLLCEGHALLEDVPGIGKTMLARALSRSLACSFQRIQFTPDLLPSDITGVSVFNQKTSDFEFRPGPLAAQVVLADEINRAGPRTQSALLEAMEERQVTVDGVTRPLPRPFLVLATQNPVELSGTFPLPEAQMDRFLLRIAIGYPEEDDERAILRRFRTANPLAELQPVLGVDELLHLQAAVRSVYVHTAVEQYIVRLIRATRAHPAVQLGGSPRSTLALYRTAQARAALHGRTYVRPDDVQALLQPVLGHRLVLATYINLRGKSVADVLAEVAAATPVPVEESWSVETPAAAALPAEAQPGKGTRS